MLCILLNCSFITDPLLEMHFVSNNSNAAKETDPNGRIVYINQESIPCNENAGALFIYLLNILFELETKNPLFELLDHFILELDFLEYSNKEVKELMTKLVNNTTHELLPETLPRVCSVM